MTRVISSEPVSKPLTESDKASIRSAFIRLGPYGKSLVFLMKEGNPRIMNWSIDAPDYPVMTEISLDSIMITKVKCDDGRTIYRASGEAVDKSRLITRGGGRLKNTTSTVGNPSKSLSSGVPYYNVDFMGDFDRIFNDSSMVPEYFIDCPEFNRAICWCNITGHSMEPEINHGDIIALGEISSVSFFPYGEIYAIVTTTGMRTVRRIEPNSNPDYYSLVPTNKSPGYMVQEIPKSVIYRMYEVLGCMKKFNSASAKRVLWSEPKSSPLTESDKASIRSAFIRERRYGKSLIVPMKKGNPRIMNWSINAPDYPVYTEIDIDSIRITEVKGDDGTTIYRASGEAL